MWIGDLTLRLRNWIAEVAQDGPFGNHATLTDGLVSYWALDELSGTRYDSVVATGNDLTDNNTVLYQNLGPNGVVTKFTSANSEYLSGTAHSSFSGGTARTVALWFRTPDPGGVVNPTIFGVQDSAGGADRRVAINVAGSSPNITLAAYGGGGALNTTTGGLLTADTWYFLVYTYDGTTHKVYIDNSVVITDAGADSGSTTGLFFGNSAAGPWNGNLSLAGTWSVELAEAERISLYNSGLGKAYSDLTAAEKVGLVSYWNLDEVSGVRYDSHGANDLTDNNTVGSVASGPSGVVAQFTNPNSESLSCSTTGLFTQSAARTVAMWFREDLSGANQSLLSIGANAGDGSRAINVNTGGTTPNMTVAIYGDGGAVNTTTGGLIATGLWHHLVYTYGGGTSNHVVYLDGTAIITDAGADSGNYTNFFLGASAAGYWGGLIARVGVWSRVIDSGDVTSLFNSGVGKSYADLTAAELVGLVSYWDLTETSGTRSDSHGTNHLTDNNTVGYTINRPGFGNAASFVASNDESLSKASFTNSTSFTFAGWFWNPALPSNETAIAIDGGAWVNDYPITVYSAAGTTLAARSGDGSGSVLVENAGVNTGAWHFLVAWIDDSDKKLRIQIDDAAVTVSSALAGSVVTPTATLQFGDSPEITTNWNGRMAHLMYWSRVLTSQERTDLFNAGRGLFYND